MSTSPVLDRELLEAETPFSIVDPPERPDHAIALDDAGLPPSRGDRIMACGKRIASFIDQYNHKWVQAYGCGSRCCHTCALEYAKKRFREYEYYESKIPANDKIIDLEIRFYYDPITTGHAIWHVMSALKMFGKGNVIAHAGLVDTVFSAKDIIIKVLFTSLKAFLFRRDEFATLLWDINHTDTILDGLRFAGGQEHDRSEYKTLLKEVLKPELPEDDEYVKGEFEAAITKTPDHPGTQIFMAYGIRKQPIGREVLPSTDLPPSEDESENPGDENTVVTHAVHHCPKCGSRATHTTGWLPVTMSPDERAKAKWKRIIYP